MKSIEFFICFLYSVIKPSVDKCLMKYKYINRRKIKSNFEENRKIIPRPFAAAIERLFSPQGDRRRSPLSTFCIAPQLTPAAEANFPTLFPGFLSIFSSAFSMSFGAPTLRPGVPPIFGGLNPSLLNVSEP